MNGMRSLQTRIFIAGYAMGVAFIAVTLGLLKMALLRCSSGLDGIGCTIDSFLVAAVISAALVAAIGGLILRRLGIQRPFLGSVGVLLMVPCLLIGTNGFESIHLITMLVIMPFISGASLVISQRIIRLRFAHMYYILIALFAVVLVGAVLIP